MAAVVVLVSSVVAVVPAVLVLEVVVLHVAASRTRRLASEFRRKPLTPLCSVN